MEFDTLNIKWKERFDDLNKTNEDLKEMVLNLDQSCKKLMEENKILQNDNNMNELNRRYHAKEEKNSSKEYENSLDKLDRDLGNLVIREEEEEYEENENNDMIGRSFDYDKEVNTRTSGNVKLKESSNLSNRRGSNNKLLSDKDKKSSLYGDQSNKRLYSLSNRISLRSSNNNGVKMVKHSSNSTPRKTKDRFKLAPEFSTKGLDKEGYFKRKDTDKEESNNRNEDIKQLDMTFRKRDSQVDDPEEKRLNLSFSKMNNDPNSPDGNMDMMDKTYTSDQEESKRL